jgi:hypothetical protein
VNASVTDINLYRNKIGDEGASALIDALKVNTSITNIDLDYDNDIGKSKLACVDELLARNKRLRHLFLFDARQMLSSVLCADECGVVWPYLLDSDDTDGIVARNDTAAHNDIDALRVVFATVVEERRRRVAAETPVPAPGVDAGDGRATKRQRR